MSREAALAALAVQWEAGVTDAIGELPVAAFGLPDEAPWRGRARGVSTARPAVASMPAPATEGNRPAQDVDPLVAAEAAAAGATTLPALAAALAAYPHCELKKGARSTVFADGNPVARVLILGEAPGREEDLEGRPFVGRAGQLLDRMFAAIGLSRSSPDREAALYITNVLPWRPPGNRDPEPPEVAMMLPFVRRHIALVDPEVVVVMGNTPLAALTGTRGILKARGHWTEAEGRPVLPMAHPAYLLRQSSAKRDAWADLLALAARLGI